MKKFWLLGLLVPFFGLFSCTEDSSAYEPQQKEEVSIDSIKVEQNKEEEDILPEGKLVPGMHRVSLDITAEDGSISKRDFKYYMPISLDGNKPISLVFDFHGAYPFANSESIPDPLQPIGVNNGWAQLAIKRNCVICYPAGEIITKEDGSGEIDWRVAGNHYSFVEAMVKYFKDRTPSIDPNRIYISGQSSGAIFCFELALKYPTVFAAACTRSGQKRLVGSIPEVERAMPILAIGGEDDDIVNHFGMIMNMTTWAEKIGGYYEDDMVFTENAISIEDYKTIDTRVWSKGKTDYILYTVKEADHFLSLHYLSPYIWDFLDTHTLDRKTDNMFVNTSVSDFEINCGEKLVINFKTNENASVSVSEVPKGWNLTLDETRGTLTVEAPRDYYANIVREGTFDIVSELNGDTGSKTIRYKLNVPKNFFEIGDIYYSEDFIPVGVVVWVNPENIREAKVMNLKNGQCRYSGPYNKPGLGNAFTTPNRTDGQENTDRMVEANNKLENPWDTRNAAFVWANNLNVNGVSGWYLPAIEELAEISKNLDLINERIRSVKGTPLIGNRKMDCIIYSSTTYVAEGSDRKTVYAYNFTNAWEEEKESRNNYSEDWGYVKVRGIKIVTKK